MDFFNKEMDTQEERCSFCGKPKSQTGKLINGPGDFCICDECVDICNQLLKEDEQKNQEQNYKYEYI